MKLSVFVCSAVGVATGLHAEPALLHGLLLATPAAAAWLPQATHADRRAFLSGAIAAASGLAPLPAFARSKEKAAQMALQKSTAKEARAFPAIELGWYHAVVHSSRSVVAVLVPQGRR